MLGMATVLAGWVLWLKDMSLAGSLGDWVSSRFGLVLTIGGVLATTSAFVGAIGVGLRVERLSTKTVATHVGNIFAKLHVRNRAEAATFAQSHLTAETPAR